MRPEQRLDLFSELYVAAAGFLQEGAAREMFSRPSTRHIAEARTSWKPRRPRVPANELSGLESALTAPASVAAGGSITVKDTVKNNGGGAAGPSTTKFFLSADAVLDANDVLLASRSVGGLGPGQTNAGATSVVVPNGTAAGNYFVIAVADADGQVAETSETNNARAKALRVN